MPRLTYRVALRQQRVAQLKAERDRLRRVIDEGYWRFCRSHNAGPVPSKIHRRFHRIDAMVKRFEFTNEERLAAVVGREGFPDGRTLRHVLQRVDERRRGQPMPRNEQNVMRDERRDPAAMTEPLADWLCPECGYDRAAARQDNASNRRCCAWCGRLSTSKKRKPAAGGRSDG